VELNSITLSDFTKLGQVIWTKGAESVKNYMMDSGMVKVMDIPEASGSTREFSEIDTNEYLTYKGQEDQAARGKIQQGLGIVPVKSLLINGENLKTAVKRFMATLRKALSHLQRLSEETPIFGEATVRTVWKHTELSRNDSIYFLRGIITKLIPIQ